MSLPSLCSPAAPLSPKSNVASNPSSIGFDVSTSALYSSRASCNLVTNSEFTLAFNSSLNSLYKASAFSKASFESNVISPNALIVSSTFLIDAASAASLSATN